MIIDSLSSARSGTWSSCKMVVSITEFVAEIFEPSIADVVELSVSGTVNVATGMGTDEITELFARTPIESSIKSDSSAFRGTLSTSSAVLKRAVE